MKKDNERMNHLRDSYDGILVPREAGERIKAGIEAAKKEEKRGVILRIVRNTGVTAAAAVMMIGVLANASPGIANAMEDIPIIGALAKVVTFRTFEDKSGNFEADIKVPQVTVEENETARIAANKSIEEYAGQLIRQYEAELQKNQGEGHYSLSSSYDVATDNSRFLSIRIHTTEVMASGAESVKIFTIDKKTGETVSLEDLFGNVPDYREKISGNIKEQMTAQMAADESVLYFYGGEDTGDDFDKISGDESFYFNENGELVIAFDEYEVAPGYMGAVEFAIPKSVTGDI